MAWKCPRCSNTNDDSIKRCTCGYAFHEILGVEPDASVQKIEQTYKYLISVWGNPGSFNETSSRKKAEERLKSIKDAYTLFRHFTPGVEEIPERKNISRFVTIAAVIIVLSVAILSFIFKRGNVKESSTQSQGSAEEQSQPSNQVETRNITPGSITFPAVESKTERQQAPSGNTGNPPALPSEKTEEWAIESVKKTYLQRALTDVESMINKWTNDNAGKYKVIGWQAKKMDEQNYLVSYTVSDGITMKGFYFEISTETGMVKPLEEHPELQKKYGIEFNR